MTDPKHIVLVGLMGSGKSTVGLLVAERLGRPFVDGDSVLRLHHGVSAREFVERDGPEPLHRAEAEMLERIVRYEHNDVVFAAAASVLDDGEPSRFDGAWVVWLDAAPEVLVERIEQASERGAGTHRPFVQREALATLRAQLAARRGNAIELAHLHVTVDDIAPAEAADRIVDAWQRATDHQDADAR